MGDTWKNARKIKLKNSSLFKIDILVYPEFSFKNVIITQIYQILFDLSPAIEISLWKGMKATAQVKIPVYNDGYGAREGKVHSGFLTLSQRFRSVSYTHLCCKNRHIFNNTKDFYMKKWNNVVFSSKAPNKYSECLYEVY